jgi:hypothetical protein
MLRDGLICLSPQRPWAGFSFMLTRVHLLAALAGWLP